MSAPSRITRSFLFLCLLLGCGCVDGSVDTSTVDLAVNPCDEPDAPDDCPDPDPEPDPDPQPTPLPVEGDNDGDRLVDTYENQLLARFAPKVWLHSAENRWPVNVSWLLARSTLRYAHDGCSDDQIIAMGAVNTTNLTAQQHRDKRGWASWDPCSHHGDYHRSNSHEGSTTDTFFLQFPDSAHTGIAPSSKSSWRIYGHVYRMASGHIEIQYWQLYSFNDSVASANHEGDWEYSTVVIDAQERPVRVGFFRHGHLRGASPTDVEWVGDHHVTFSAKGGHGQYREVTSGDDWYCNGDGFLDDAQGAADVCGRGVAWNTWEQAATIVNVGEKYQPLNNSGWIRYSGLWGEIGAASDVISFTSGPRGPAYKGTWIRSSPTAEE